MMISNRILVRIAQMMVVSAALMASPAWAAGDVPIFCGCVAAGDEAAMTSLTTGCDDFADGFSFSRTRLRSARTGDLFTSEFRLPDGVVSCSNFLDAKPVCLEALSIFVPSEPHVCVGAPID